MYDDKKRDPWDWTTKQTSTAPLGNTLQVAQVEPAMQPIPQQKDPLEEMVKGKVMNKASGMAEKGAETIWDAATKTQLPVAAAVEPIAATAEGALSQGIIPASQAVSAGAAATGAAATGTEAMLGALGPVGWGIGGILLARKLGLFS